jgi:hypothetical protein
MQISSEKSKNIRNSSSKKAVHRSHFWIWSLAMKLRKYYIFSNLIVNVPNIWLREFASNLLRVMAKKSKDTVSQFIFAETTSPISSETRECTSIWEPHRSYRQSKEAGNCKRMSYAKRESATIRNRCMRKLPHCESSALHACSILRFWQRSQGREPEMARRFTKWQACSMGNCCVSVVVPCTNSS